MKPLTKKDINKAVITDKGILIAHDKVIYLEDVLSALALLKKKVLSNEVTRFDEDANFAVIDEQQLLKVIDECFQIGHTSESFDSDYMSKNSQDAKGSSGKGVAKSPPDANNIGASSQVPARHNYKDPDTCYKHNTYNISRYCPECIKEKEQEKKP